MAGRRRGRASEARACEGRSGRVGAGCSRSTGGSSGANDRDGASRVSTSAGRVVALRVVVGRADAACSVAATDGRLGMAGILATPAHPSISEPWIGCGQPPQL